MQAHLSHALMANMVTLLNFMIQNNVLGALLDSIVNLDLFKANVLLDFIVMWVQLLIMTLINYVLKIIIAIKVLFILSVVLVEELLLTKVLRLHKNVNNVKLVITV